MRYDFLRGDQSMTPLLQKVIEQLTRLPEREQDIVAAWILEELKSEQRWEELFAASQDKLALLADEALDEFHKDETRPLDPDEL